MKQTTKNKRREKITYYISILANFILSAYGFYLISGLSRFNISAMMDFDKILIMFITVTATMYWISGIIGTSDENNAG